MARLIYSLVTFAASLVCLPIFICHPRGRRRVWERYGLWGIDSPDEVFWFHGASVGEVGGLLPVIDRCRTRFPQRKILLTATSPTGLERAAGKADYLRLLPFDNRLWLALALRRLKPRILVFGETELWPNMLAVLARAQVPMLLVNGRLSEFSRRYYGWLKPLVRDALRELSAIFVLNEKYQARFVEFGADPECVIVSGNAKYDSAPSVADCAQAAELKAVFFTNDPPVLVLGSLRPGEEAVWFPAVTRAFSDGVKVNVIVAPRHQEKTAFFAERLTACGLQYERWSERKEQRAPAPTAVVLLDTLGDLEPAYSFADLAFIGGTLIPGIGGHNPLEAAAYGVCIALGPHCENIDDVAAGLEAAGGVRWVRGEADAVQLLRQVGARDAVLREAGERAQLVWRRHSGACEAIVDKIATLI